MMAPYRDDEHELLAWIEGELAESEARAVEARLAEDPDLRRLCEMMRADRAALRAMGDVDAPEGLVDDVQHALERAALLDGDAEPSVIAGPEAFESRRHGAWKRWVGVAACLAVAGGVFMVGHRAGFLPTSPRSPAPPASGQFAVETDAEKDEERAAVPTRQEPPDVWSEEFPLGESVREQAGEKGGRLDRGAGVASRGNLRDATTARQELAVAAEVPESNVPDREVPAETEAMVAVEDTVERAGDTIAKQAMAIEAEPAAPTPARGREGAMEESGTGGLVVAGAESSPAPRGAESAESSSTFGVESGSAEAIASEEFERLIARREVYLRLSKPEGDEVADETRSMLVEGPVDEPRQSDVTSETTLHEYIWRLGQIYSQRPDDADRSADGHRSTAAAGRLVWAADGIAPLPPDVASELIEGLERLRVVRRLEAEEPGHELGVAFLQLGRRRVPTPFLTESWQVELVRDRAIVLEAERLLLQSQDSLLWWRHDPWVTPQRTAWLVMDPEREEGKPALNDEAGDIAPPEIEEPAPGEQKTSSEDDAVIPDGDPE